MGSVPCFTAQRNQCPLPSEAWNNLQICTKEFGKVLREQLVTVGTRWSAGQALRAVQGWTPALSSRRSQAGIRELLEDRDGGYPVQLCIAVPLPPWCQGKGHTHLGLPF